MCHRRLIVAAALVVVIASVSPLVVPAAGQTQAAPKTTWTPPRPTYVAPRTPWGDPDLHGVYDFLTRIPMERPDKYAGKAVLTDQEWAQWLKENPANMQGYNDFWNNRDFARDQRTSLVVDPPDGRIPPFTPEAQKKVAAFQQAMAERRKPGRSQYESWEDFRSVSRCISVHTPNGPMDYNSGTLLMQSPGWVVLVRERLDTRVIPLDGRPHVEDHIRQWNGDSRGHWEGSTLVVETTNFTPKQHGIGNGKPQTEPGASAGFTAVPTALSFGNFRLIEHFVPTAADKISYYATLEDPGTWTRPWTFMLPWEKNDDYRIYEYACSEGDISIGNALRGERLIEEKERKAAEAAKK